VSTTTTIPDSARTGPAARPSAGTSATAAPAVQEHLRIGHGAVLHAIKKNTVTVVLPALGKLQLPPPQALAWLGGLATLTALGLLEWPVAVVIGAGHLLAVQSHVKLLRDFGEALESA
jgi:hypothetical protein